MITNFDVVVCTVKRHFVLKKCVENILKNNIRPNRLIVVDQNHDDLSILSIKKIFSIYNFKNYLILKNISKKGLTASKNIALNYLISKYVFFLDDVISIERFFFENSLNLIFKKKCIGVCGTLSNYNNHYFKNLIYHFFNYQEYRDNRKYFNDKKIFKLNNKYKKIYHLPGGITCFDSKIFVKIKFDEKLITHNYEDVDFNLRLKKKFKDYSSYISLNSYANDLVKKNAKENINKRTYFMRLLYLKHKNLKFFIIFYLSFMGILLTSILNLKFKYILEISGIFNQAKKKIKTIN